MNRLSMTPFFPRQMARTVILPIKKSRGFQQEDGIEGPREEVLRNKPKSGIWHQIYIDLYSS
jgi:hypothetical protein